MKLSEITLTGWLRKIWPRKSVSSKRVTGRIVLAHWDRESVYYLVATSKNKQLIARDFGQLKIPTGTSALSVLSQHLKTRNLSAQQLVILLSRPELEQATLSLPPTTTEELPALVSGAIEQQLGETEAAQAIDFIQLNQPSDPENGTIEVQTFSLQNATLEALKQEAESAGFRTIAIASRQLASLPLLHGKSLLSHLNVFLHLYPGEIEFTVCEGDRPRLLRSLRVNQEDSQRWSELIRREVQRCVTLLPPELEELPQQWVIVDSSPDSRMLARSLGDSSTDSITLVDPLTGWTHDQRLTDDLVTSSESIAVASSTDDTSRTSPEASSVSSSVAVADQAQELPDSAEAQDSEATNAQVGTGVLAMPIVDSVTGALAGAAWEVLIDGLKINLLDPKRPPLPPNPWLKPVGWSSVAALAASFAGYALLSDVWHMESDVDQMQQQVQESSKLAAKLQEKSDQTQLVENWLSDQTDWLSVLGEIADRMPEGQQATVSRLSASTDGKRGVLDLSVQVADPENITQLESRLRSVKYEVSSKRISQTPEAKEFPWRFETRLNFNIDLADWRDFQPAVESPAVQPVSKSSDANSQTLEPASESTSVSVEASVDESSEVSK